MEGNGRFSIDDYIWPVLGILFVVVLLGAMVQAGSVTGGGVLLILLVSVGFLWWFLREGQRLHQKQLEQLEQKCRKKRFEFSAWMTDTGIDLECTRCLSRDFNMIQYSLNGLSFHGQCRNCKSKKWFKVQWTKNPFDFAAYEFVLEHDAWAIPRTNQPVDDPQVNAGQQDRNRNIPEHVRHEVWRRDQGQCSKCGSNENIEFDHIIPFSKGGANTVRNIQLLCETCNREKSDRI